MSSFCIVVLLHSSKDFSYYSITPKNRRLGGKSFLFFLLILKKL
ncbi:hypothetical protein D931_02628 [Enterococcus faecium 13.SD.W.09]|nr:hypothetical protein D931_02628 [Enterococcus faecium 13.SD.W.09]